MGACTVLDVGERLEDVGDPGRVARTSKVGMADHVSGTVDAVPGAQASRAQSATRCGGSLVGRSYDPLSVQLGHGIIGEELVVLLWKQRVVHVVDHLDGELGLTFPWPEPEPRATDAHRPRRGEDEHAGAGSLGSVDDVLGTLNIDPRRPVQEGWVPLVEADVGCRVEDGKLGGLVGGVGPRSVERGVDARAVCYVYFEKGDFGGRPGCKVFSR